EIARVDDARTARPPRRNARTGLIALDDFLQERSVEVGTPPEVFRRRVEVRARLPHQSSAHEGFISAADILVQVGVAGEAIHVPLARSNAEGESVAERNIDRAFEIRLAVHERCK